EPLRSRAAGDLAGLRIVGRAMTGADDLAGLVADRAARVGTDRAERREAAVGLADDDVGLSVGRIGVRRALLGRQSRRRGQLDRVARHGPSAGTGGGSARTGRGSARTGG